MGGAIPPTTEFDIDIFVGSILSENQSLYVLLQGVVDEDTNLPIGLELHRAEKGADGEVEGERLALFQLSPASHFNPISMLMDENLADFTQRVL